MRVDLQQVLRHSDELRVAPTLTELVEAAARIVGELSPYRHAWIAWFDAAQEGALRTWAASGSLTATAPSFLGRGADALLEQALTTSRPLVVCDAREDPRPNKQLVVHLDARTVVLVPLVSRHGVLGVLGTGTFGDGEAPRAPTPEELDGLVLLSTLLGPAVDRVHDAHEQERARLECVSLERHVETLQRIEMMGLLSTGIAHDLNNLLAVTVASLARIRPETLGHDGELLVDALDALAHIRAIAKNLVHLGRESGLGAQPVNLTERVSVTLELVMPSIPSGVRIVRSAHGDPVVEAEPTQVDQAITNLVLNARDAVGASGRIVVDVSEHRLDARATCAHPGARPGRYGVVQVRDTGPGIAGPQLSRVLDPLFTTKPAGAGLGLAVVSRIAARHGGFISVNNAPGEGACFELYLPSTERYASAR